MLLMILLDAPVPCQNDMCTKSISKCIYTIKLVGLSSFIQAKRFIFQNIFASQFPYGLGENLENLKKNVYRLFGFYSFFFRDLNFFTFPNSSQFSNRICKRFGKIEKLTRFLSAFYFLFFSFTSTFFLLFGRSRLGGTSGWHHR